MQQAAGNEDKPYEITLSGAAWEDISATEDFYRNQVGLLKNRYIDLLLANTVQTEDTYFHLFIWNDAIHSLKPKLYDILEVQGLSLWNDFARHRLPHWCQFMNESLMNTIFLSTNCYLHLMEIAPISTGVFLHMATDQNRQRLEEVLKFVVDVFFLSHDYERTNAAYYKRTENWHTLGLAHFFRLNVLENAPAIKVTVPYPVHFETPKALEQLISRTIVEFRNMFRNYFNADNDVRFPSLVYDRGNITNDFAERPRWAYKISKTSGYYQPEARGMFLIHSLIPSQSDGLQLKNHMAWCRLMTDELIRQIYAALNMAMYVHFKYRKHFYPIRQIASRNKPFDNYQLSQMIGDICSNFFQVDCIKWSQNTARLPQLVDDSINEHGMSLRNKNQWSGKWGIRMFYHLNFVRVNREVNEFIYPQDHLHTDYFAYSLPPSMTRQDQHTRSLAIAQMGSKEMRLNTTDAAEPQDPDQKKIDWLSEMGGAQELMQLISGWSLYQEPRPTPLPPMYDSDSGSWPQGDPTGESVRSPTPD